MAKFRKGTTIGKEHRFTADYQPYKNGRKKSLYHSIIAKTGCKIRKNEFFDVIRYLMEQSIPTLEGILKEVKENPNTKTPIWICSIIEAMLKDCRYGRLIVINSLFDRLFGKPESKFEPNKRKRGR
ncbi:hypothetical protein FACS189421_13860 [Bacteroidia bacterium]|nr:hypothetical protein FACS189421_13860 [Bacteroidia bacterium]GHT50101.1 hypothetical protein FACS189440_16950 [Bacteroidia bacterium]